MSAHRGKVEGGCGAMPEETHAAALTAVVLDEEEARQAAQAAAEAGELLPDDLLPGVGGAPMPMRDGLRLGGLTMIIALLLVSVIETLDQVALQVLAPDIQRSLDVSKTTLQGLTSFGGVVLVRRDAPLRVARRPLRAHAHPRRRHVHLGVLHGPHRCRQQRGRDGVRPRGRGLRRVGAHPDLAGADRRPVPDRRAHADVRDGEPRSADRARDRTVHRRARWRDGPAAPRAGGGRWSRSRCPRWSSRSGSLFIREPARGRNEQEAVLGQAARRLRGSAGSALVGGGAPPQGQELPLPHPRDRCARVRAGERAGAAQLPVRRGLRLLGVQARLGAVAHLPPRAARDPDRRALRRSPVPPGSRATRCGCSACSSSRTALFLTVGSQLSAGRAAHRAAWRSPTRASSRRSPRWAPPSPRWCPTGCDRRRSR